MVARRETDGAAPDGDSVVRLLELLERRRPLLTSRPEDVNRQLVAGGLVAAERLFKAIRAAVDAGVADAVGGLIRTVWECWCIGEYMLLKGHGGVNHVAGYGRTQIEKIRRFWPLDEDEADPFADLPELPRLDEAKTEWNLRDVAQEVRDLLVERGSRGMVATPDALAAYDVVFRSESNWGESHAGFGLFSRLHAACAPGVGRESDSTR